MPVEKLTRTKKVHRQVPTSSSPKIPSTILGSAWQSVSTCRDLINRNDENHACFPHRATIAFYFGLVEQQSAKNGSAFTGDLP